MHSAKSIFGAKPMTQENQIQIKPEFKDAYEKLNLIFQRATSEEKAFLEKVLKFLRQNMNLSAEDVAEKVGISRRALFDRLKRLGIEFSAIKNALVYEMQLKRKEKIVKKEVKRLPPKDWKEFIEREAVQEVLKKMVKKSEPHKEKVLDIWFDISVEMGIAPEDLIDMEKEEVQKVIMDFIAKREKEGYEINSIISQIQALQLWLERPLLPPYIKQHEYKGKYTSAELTQEVRELMVNELVEACRNGKINGNGKRKYVTKDVCELTLRTWVFLYYTGSRAEALTNFIKEYEIELKAPQFIKAFNGETRFMVVRTEEKGKEGRKFIWRKLVPKNWSHLIPERQLTETEVEKVRKVTRAILMKLMEQYPDKFNEDTRKYIQGVGNFKGKVLHLWRHTFAREALRAFGWNRYLVSKLGGWVKDSNLQIYGDYDLLALIEASSEEHKMQFCSNVCKEKIEKFLSV
jgi:predicted DNA-binding protein YlxM (UPF0122 family)